jgi:hypothetical protein
MTRLSKHLFLTLLLGLLSVGTILPQFVLNARAVPHTAGVLLKFSGSLDSLTTLYSSAFTLPFSADSMKLNVGRKLTSTNLPRVTITLQGSLDGSNWDSLLTFYTADSLKTYASKKSGTNYIYPNYRIKIVGATGNRRDTRFEFFLFSWFRKEY